MTGLTEVELPYENIIAFDTGGAILHNHRRSRERDVPRRSMLIDAGAEFRGYASDITRTYSGGDRDFEQLIGALDGAQQKICSAVTAGTDYRDVHLLAFADACVVPSVFPEAFGMVAAEAAAAGCPPIVARHSGLAEVAAGLEAELPERLAPLVSFPTGDAAALHERLGTVLGLPAEDRALLRTSVRRAVEARWSWAGVARRLLDLSRYPD